MRVIKPSWLTHGGERRDSEVYSCHVSPKGNRLVTAAGDGHLRVWATESIERASDATYTGPKQLASMNNHSGTIHTARFSPNDRFLASGADDKIICVYALDSGPPSHASTFGTNESAPVENWRLFRRLIGHDNDVQDLAWSPDSSILVSVGLDSKIVVWSGHTFEKLKTLNNHQSHVKGITFDPANKYFATASDDRTLKIFRYTPPAANSTAQDHVQNFILEATIADPFKSSPLTTYFRRCSWSPDGNHIATANSVNGPVSSAAVINRGTWDSEISLIGHEGPVEVCAFSPMLYGTDPAPKPGLGEEDQQKPIFLVTVVACAGQDKTLTLWNTHQAKPLAIVQDLATKSISDIAWTPNGKNLYLSSLDGGIIGLEFGEGELGFARGLEDNEKALAKYGANRRGAGMVQGPDGFLLEEQSKASEIGKVQGRMGELMGDEPQAQSTNGPSSKKDAPRLNGSAADQMSDSAVAVPGSNVKKIEQVNGVSGASAEPGRAKELSNGAEISESNQNARVERLKQRVSYTKDGKKRIAPLLVSGRAGETQSSMPRAQLAASTTTTASRQDAPSSILDLSKPFDGLPQGGLASMLLGNRRRHVLQDDEFEKQRQTSDDKGDIPVLINQEDGLVPAQGRSKSTDQGAQPTPEYIRPAVLNPVLSVSQIRLGVPKLRVHIVRALDTAGNASYSGAEASSESITNSAEYAMEARNPTGPSPTGRAADRDPARISVSKKGQMQWQDYLPKSVLLITGNQSYWAAACEDASVHVWSPAGRRAYNPFILESQPVMLECRDLWLLCITAVGMCYVWNIKSRSSPHPPISLAPVLDIAIHSQQPHPTSGPAVTSAHLNSQGHIIVTLNNGDGYTYSSSMFVWQRLSEPWWAVGSQYWNTTDTSVANLNPQPSDSRDGEQSVVNVSAGIIPYLERKTTSEVLLRGRGYHLQRLIRSLISREGYEGFETSLSIAHLENRIAAALELESKVEFQMYLYMYAKRVGAEGLKTKASELLRLLRGPILEDDHKASDPTSSDDDMICDWPREELVRGVLLILGKHRELQRITIPYARILGMTDASAQESDPMSL